MPQLADFGLAARLHPPPTGAVGTLCYVAPEILLNRGYGAAVDMWAAGVTLYIVLSGFMPFYHPDDATLARIICRGEVDLRDSPWTWASDG
jgi:serine/threonine protein kinase